MLNCTSGQKDFRYCWVYWLHNRTVTIAKDLFSLEQKLGFIVLKSQGLLSLSSGDDKNQPHLSSLVLGLFAVGKSFKIRIKWKNNVL